MQTIDFSDPPGGGTQSLSNEPPSSSTELKKDVADFFRLHNSPQDWGLVVDENGNWSVPTEFGRLISGNIKAPECEPDIDISEPFPNDDGDCGFCLGNFGGSKYEEIERANFVIYNLAGQLIETVNGINFPIFKSGHDESNFKAIAALTRYLDGRYPTGVYIVKVIYEKELHQANITEPIKIVVQ